MGQFWWGGNILTAINGRAAEGHWVWRAQLDALQVGDGVPVSLQRGDPA